MEKVEFEQRHRHAIGVCFHWPRFNAESAIHIDQAKVSTANFNSLFAPWYVDPNGSFSSWDAPGATPLSVPQAAARLCLLSEKSRATIQHWRGEYQNGRALSPIPAYALPDDRYLILDGNHRLIALYLVGLPADIDIDVVRGPIDDGIAFDLHYWRMQSAG